MTRKITNKIIDGVYPESDGGQVIAPIEGKLIHSLCCWRLPLLVLATLRLATPPLQTTAHSLITVRRDLVFDSLKEIFSALSMENGTHIHE